MNLADKKRPTASQIMAKQLHEHAKYLGMGKCGSPTCQECA